MGYTTWSDDSVSLMKNCRLVLNRYEERFIEMNEIIGTADCTLLLVKEAIETENLEHLINELNIISEVSNYCPKPEWFSNATTYYYFITDTKTTEMRMAQAKEEFAQNPSGCLITTTNVTKEEVEAYGNRLKEWNLNPTIQWKEEKQKYELFVLIADFIRYGEFLETSLADEDTMSLRNLSRFRNYLISSI